MLAVPVPAPCGAAHELVIDGFDRIASCRVYHEEHLRPSKAFVHRVIQALFVAHDADGNPSHDDSSWRRILQVLCQVENTLKKQELGGMRLEWIGLDATKRFRRAAR